MSFFDQIISFTIDIPFYQFILVVSVLLIGGAFLIYRRWENRKSEAETAVSPNNPQITRLISHEFPTPLQTILTTLQNMAHGSGQGEAWQRNHDIALQETRRLNRLVDYVRLLTAGQTIRQPVNMVAVIENALIKFIDRAEETQVDIQYAGPERLPHVLGNRDQLTRVIENLLENGIKYRRQKVDESQVIIRAAIEPDQVCIEVADNGRGIASTDLPHIFLPTFRSSEARSSGQQGAGLGLAIVKYIIEDQHNGQIEVCSQQGESTMFSFSLPLYTSSEV